MPINICSVNMTRFERVVLAFAILCPAGRMAQNNLPVSQKCLACICEGVTSCDTRGTCSGGVCGAFRITQPYWTDSGKPTVNNESPEAPEAFSNCGRDIYCSIQAVQGYMQALGQDCNGDGKTDCDDFFMIHRVGGYDCKCEPLTGNYAQRYERCKSIIGV